MMVQRLSSQELILVQSLLKHQYLGGGSNYNPLYLKTVTIKRVAFTLEVDATDLSGIKTFY